MKQGELSHLILEAFDGAGSVPADDPWCIPNVKILGLVSKNGRRYSEQCLREAVSLYEGKPLCNDHPSGDVESRNPDDVLGYFRNVRFQAGDGLRADLHFTRRGELAESVKIASKDNPKLYGFSHNIPRGGSVSRIDSSGTQIVESITKVNSIDLVTKPATTDGMFEGVQPVTTPKKIKPREVIMAAVTMPAEKLRFERIFESMGDLAGIEVEPGNVATMDKKDASPEEVIKENFKGMMGSLIEAYMTDGDDGKLISGIKNAAKACGLMLKGGEPKVESEDGEKKADAAPEAKPDEEKKESVQKPAVLGHNGAAALLESKNIPITSSLLESIGSVTEQQAGALVESLVAERKRADDLEKRLNVIPQHQQTKSVARGGFLLESVQEPEAKEYKPMFLIPSAN